MKKYLQWAGVIIATPFILFIILCILIYIPPIQNFAVKKATQIASESTGMNISIGRISLSFPLDLVVHNTLVSENQDTILQSEKLTVQIQFLPLLKKQIELDGLELKGTSVNTGKLINGISVKGDLGKLFISSHGVELTPETAVINHFQLEDTHLSLCITDTTTTDTTQSEPIYWKFQLDDILLKNVSFAMQMPLDTMDFSIALKEASLQKGMVDLHRSAYAAQQFRLSGSNITFNSGNTPTLEQGFDPSHINLTNLNLAVDSVYYADKNMHAYIQDFILTERSGLEITSTQGELQSDHQALKIPGFKIHTKDSRLELQASIDWSAASMQKEGNIDTHILADIGKNDLGKILGNNGADFMDTYPDQPLKIRADLNGDINNIHLSTFSVDLPQAFHIQAQGNIAHTMDSLKRKGEVFLNMEVQDIAFLKQILADVNIPSGIKLDGKAQVEGKQLQTDLNLLTKQQGKAKLTAQYNLQQEAYDMQLNIDTLNLNAFLPKDSLYRITAAISAQGKGMNLFSPHTSASISGKLSQFEYGNYDITGVCLEAALNKNKADIALNMDNQWINLQTSLTGSITPNLLQANLVSELERMDLQALGITNYAISPSFRLESQLKTNLKNSHHLQTTIQNIALSTNGQVYNTKNIHANVEITPDSLQSAINSGDLTLWFKSQTSLEKLMSDLTHLSSQALLQWQKKHIDQQIIRDMLPNTEMGIYAKTDNPLANLLAAKRIKYNELSINLHTTPQSGLNASANLYGLRTDSVQLDTIYLNVLQDTARLNFFGGVKALSNKRQEGFDVSLKGNFRSTEGDLNIAYLNDKKEQGVDMGMKVFLRKEGISLHVSPEKPTLVYRTFYVNPDNYIYLSDKGRIHAKLDLFDKNHSGLSLYSTPDSLTQQDLTLSLNKIDIEEFQRIIPYMPDIAGSISSEVHYIQKSDEIQIAADMQINHLAYNKQLLGNLGMDVSYLPQDNGQHQVNGFITINNQEVININGGYSSAYTPKGKDIIKAQIDITHLPLTLANAFIPDQMAKLSGDLDGAIFISGSSDRPIFNGKLNMDSVSVNIPQAALTLKLDEKPLVIKNSKLKFDQFKILSKGQAPFIINGEVDMADLDINLQMNARNFELLNAKKNKEALVYGKLYVDLISTIKGNPEDLKMRGNMNILGNSDFTYILKDSPLTVEDRLNETVKFVNFSDTLDLASGNIPAMSLGGVDMLMTLHIDEAVQARVDLNLDGSNYMFLEGGGDLSFQYQPDGNIVLNGKYGITNGEMKYQLPFIPLKTFRIKEDSYIEWTGNMMNPKLNIKATEQMRASVSTEDGGSRSVNFDVGVSITNRLENLGFIFTLDAPNDGNMQNELASKSAEERNKLAVTMLVTGIYLGEGNNVSGKANTSNTLNNYLQGQINKMAGKMAGSALKTIDINLGIETNEQQNGTSSTDYNFQFAKRFWNNRFQVVIGGKISTGNNVQQDESFIDNVSLEYRLDKSGTRYIKLFHDKNYESILDGEVIETGAGVVLRKKVSKLSELFIFRNRKKNQSAENKEKRNNNEKK